MLKKKSLSVLFMPFLALLFIFFAPVFQQQAFADTTPPTVTVTPSGNPSWTTNTQATISATDTADGVKSISWQICLVSDYNIPYNCTTMTTTSTSSLTVTLPQGDYGHGKYLGVQATDNAGNVSAEQYYKFLTDTVAPTTHAYIDSGINWVRQGSSTTQHYIELYSTDNSSGNATENLKLVGSGTDQAQGKVIQASHDFTKVVNNTYLDDWGYYEGTYDADNLNYYQTDPLITFTDAHTTWDGSDSGTGYITSIVPTFYYYTTTCTLCTFDVYSEWTDGAGLQSGYTTKAMTYGIDGIAPTGSVTSGDSDGLWHKSIPTINYTISDQGSGFSGTAGAETYTVYKDGTVFSSGNINTSNGATSYNGTLNVTPTASGNYQVVFSIKDLVGNPSTFQTGIYHIDLDAPTVSFSPNGTGGVWTNLNQNVTVTPTDIGGSGIASWQYRISSNDGTTYGSWTVGTGASAVVSLPTVSGKYRIQVQAIDNVGNMGTITSQSYWIDTTAPTASFSPNGTGGAWTNLSQNVTVTPTDTGGSGVLSWQYQISSDDGVTYGSWTTGTGSSQVVSLPSATGKYRIKTQVTDNAGNTSTVTSNSYWIDMTAPTITFSQNPTGWSNNNQMTIQATDVDSGVQNIQYQVCPVTTMGSPYSCPTFTTTTNSSVTITLPEGWKYLNVQSTDKAGNVSTKSTYTWTDTGNPSVGGSINLGTFSSNGANWVKASSSQTYDIQLGGTDATSGLSTEDLHLIGTGSNQATGKDIRATQNFANDIDGQDDWGYDQVTNSSLNYYQTDPLINFTSAYTELDDYPTWRWTDYYFTTSCTLCTFDLHSVWTDRTGNQTDTKVETIGFDGIAPTGTITSGDSDGLWHKSIPTINYTISDQGSGFPNTTGAETYTVYKDGTVFSSGNINITTNGTKSYSGTLNVVPTASGNYQAVFSIKDGVGNTSSFQTGIYHIDKDLPNGTFAPNGTGGVWTNAQNVTITPTDTGGSGIASWQYRISNDDGATYGSWVTGSGSSANVTLNTEGKNRIQVQVTDGAGNVNTITSQSYWIDMTPPSITISGVTDGGKYTGATPSFSVSDAKSGVNNSSLTATLSRTFEGDTTTSSFTSGTAITMAGNFTLTVNVTDNAGNSSAKSVSFTIVPPPMLSVTPVNNIDTNYSGTFVYPLQPTLSLSVSATDSIPTAVITLYYDIKENGVVTHGATAVSSVTPVSGTWDTSVWNTVDLESNLVKSLQDGQNTIEFWIQDDQGASSAKISLPLIVDSASPTSLTLYDLPTGTSSVSINSTIKFSVSAEDPPPSDGSYQNADSVNVSFDIRKNGVEITPTPTTQVKLNGQPSDPIEMFLGDSDGYRVGDVITITPILDDGRGNISSTPTYTVQITG